MLKRNVMPLRSAILTITNDPQFISSIKRGYSFPLFSSATSFTQSLTESLDKAYRDKGIDVMHVTSPLASFESKLTSYGSIVPNKVLQVVMEERLLSEHVKAVFAQLISGYSKSIGSSNDYLANSKLGVLFSTQKLYHQKQVVQMMNNLQYNSDSLSETESSEEEEGERIRRLVRQEVAKQMKMRNGPLTPKTRSSPPRSERIQTEKQRTHENNGKLTLTLRQMNSMVSNA